jgi:hypothetical protein
MNYSQKECQDHASCCNCAPSAWCDCQSKISLYHTFISAIIFVPLYVCCIINLCFDFVHILDLSSDTFGTVLLMVERVAGLPTFLGDQTYFDCCVTKIPPYIPRHELSQFCYCRQIAYNYQFVASFQ